ncbi:hypothetical protein [Negadavirga shengliensis]|uniref:Ketohydroxyglutarate aldolase n=1 Tax=Negadavirga shengliensis TaxID=1389218 RepID=A0ABV9T4S0_9BACT
MSITPKNFIASVEDGQIKKIDAIVQQLEDKGCKITGVLSTLGIITGCSSGMESSLDELKVKGIKHIEEDRTLRALEEED